ncbi:MAG: response regulator [Leptospira sp.]|nr:response regulator [Leptospira sp.]
MKKIYNILIAEDDEPSAKLVLSTLDRYNFSVSHVLDGQQALSQVQLRKFDLIISDIIMPRMDGLLFLEKANEQIENTPVILLTASAEKENVRRAALHKITFYLLKPITPLKLMEKIKEALKIDEDWLVDKKMIPFKVLVSMAGVGHAKATLFGCPGKKSEDEIYAEIVNFMARNVGIAKVTLEIKEEFAYENKCVEILEAAVARLGKSGKINLEDISISGGYTKYADVVKIRNSKDLSRCVIEMT